MVFSHEKKQNWFSFRARLDNILYILKKKYDSYKFIKLVEFSALVFT